MNYIKKYQAGGYLSKSFFRGVNPTRDVPTNALGYISKGSELLGGLLGQERVIPDKVAEAAWAKRLNQPYDSKYLPENKDGSVRLPDDIAKQINFDTLDIKNKINLYNKIINSKIGSDYSEDNRINAKGNLPKLESYLGKLREAYKGNHVVVNEYESRKGAFDDYGYLNTKDSPLNVMGNYTIWYNPEEKAKKYQDFYDFNGLDWAVPGKSFKIKGVVPKKQGGGNMNPKDRLKQYYASQADKGRKAVTQGSNKFAQEYMLPAAKTAASFTPIGPVIGLLDAKHAYDQGKTGTALASAGLEALPYGLKYAGKVTKQIVKNFPQNIKIGKYEILPTPKQTAYYRNIGGKEGYIDVVSRQEVAPPKISSEKLTLRDPEGNIRLPQKQFNRAFYANQGEFSPALRYRGPYAIEANVPMRNKWGGNWGYAPDPKKVGYMNVPLNIPEVRILKQYRLPKTEKVLFQKELSKINNN